MAMLTQSSFLAALAAGCAAIGWASLALAQTPEEWAARARASSDIRTLNTKPFHLHAEIRIAGIDDKPEDGTLDLIWVSPNKWREDVAMGQLNFSRVGLDKTIYTSPPPDYVPIHLAWLEGHILPDWSSSDDVEAVSTKWEQGESKEPDTIALERPKQPHMEVATKTDVTFDPASGNLLRYDGATYANFQLFQGKQIATSGKEAPGKNTLAVFAIRKMETIPTPDEDVFHLDAPVVQYSNDIKHDVGPKILSSVNPEFSEYARKQRISGSVTLKIGVDAHGKVREVQVERSLESSLDMQAIKAARQYRFAPAMRDGVPIPCYPTLVIRFKIYQ